MSNSVYLLYHLTKKDIEAKYKGSVLGMMWSFLTPLLMLAIYTFVFSEIFQAKWNIDTENKFSFAMILFSGLNVITMMNDVLNRSTTLIASHTNYVKKVIFPLNILPLTVVFSNLFNCLIGYIILLTANLLLTHTISPTAWLLPVALIPLILLSAGVGYIVSGLSVYLKDLTSVTAVFTMLLMYVSPVFFPLEALPPAFATICMVNPLTFIIENVRNVSLYGNMLNMQYWLISMAESGAALQLGISVFDKLKAGFPDVL
jgi:lipopolysaccharide transport system permease protein